MIRTLLIMMGAVVSCKLRQDGLAQQGILLLILSVRRYVGMVKGSQGGTSVMIRTRLMEMDARPFVLWNQDGVVLEVAQDQRTRALLHVEMGLKEEVKSVMTGTPTTTMGATAPVPQ